MADFHRILYFSLKGPLLISFLMPLSLKAHRFLANCPRTTLNHHTQLGAAVHFGDINKNVCAISLPARRNVFCFFQKKEIILEITEIDHGTEIVQSDRGIKR